MRQCHFLDKAKTAVTYFRHYVEERHILKHGGFHLRLLTENAFHHKRLHSFFFGEHLHHETAVAILNSLKYNGLRLDSYLCHYFISIFAAKVSLPVLSLMKMR